MSDFKLVTIIGIHSGESLLNCSPDEAEAKWKAAVSNPDFVAAVLFKGGQIAPLSGQSFRLLKAKARKAP